MHVSNGAGTYVLQVAMHVSSFAGTYFASHSMHQVFEQYFRQSV